MHVKISDLTALVLDLCTYFVFARTTVWLHVICLELPFRESVHVVCFYMFWESMGKEQPFQPGNSGYYFYHPEYFHPFGNYSYHYHEVTVHELSCKINMKSFPAISTILKTPLDVMVFVKAFFLLNLTQFTFLPILQSPVNCPVQATSILCSHYTLMFCVFLSRLYWVALATCGTTHLHFHEPQILDRWFYNYMHIRWWAIFE